jgi:hypothetical protein
MPFPAPSNQIKSLVVMLYGRGGFGKSALLERFHTAARRSLPHLAVSEIVDWEAAIEGNRSAFLPSGPGQRIDAGVCSQVLCTPIALALGKRLNDFKEYQKAVRDIREARQLAGNALDALQKDDRYGALRKMSLDMAIAVVKSADPTPFTKWLDTDRNREGLDDALRVGVESLRQIIIERWHARLGSEWIYALDSDLVLGLGLGRDLAFFARKRPLLIFFDTYEEIAEADHFLKIVMKVAGTRVGWVLAGRDNLWSGAEQHKRSLEVEFGYKDIVHRDYGLGIDFDSTSIGPFTLHDILSYFQQLPLNKRVQRSISEMEARQILELTQGVPMAVKIAAGLYLETADIQLITERAQDRDKVIEVMVNRYLRHTRSELDEKERLYGLALLRRAGEVGIAAALGFSQEQARTNYEVELTRRHRRYSFVFTEKAQPSLHQEVRYFLRLWLLKHQHEARIIVVNQRLQEAHKYALQQLEERRPYRSLKERVLDDEWIGIYLDLVEQTFWLDPFEGVRHILPIVIAARSYRSVTIDWTYYAYDEGRRSIVEEALTIGAFFVPYMHLPAREWWEYAVGGIQDFIPGNSSISFISGMEKLADLIGENQLTFFSPVPHYKAELEALQWWQLGDAYRYLTNICLCLL